MFGKSRVVIEFTINGAIVRTFDNVDEDGKQDLCGGMPVQRTVHVVAGGVEKLLEFVAAVVGEPG